MDDLLARLVRRREMLDAVVFSGGEPTAQPLRPLAAAQVRGERFPHEDFGRDLGRLFESFEIRRARKGFLDPY